MSAPARYLLDANIFLEAKKRYYAFDICPGFWASLISHHGGGRLLSIDRVRDELLPTKDELSLWADQTAPASMWMASDEPNVVREFSTMMAWVSSQPQFMSAAKADFAIKADGWLIACAKASGCVMVTHEVYAADARKKVPMPNVCRQFGVPVADTFAMLRDLGVKFH